MDNPKKLKVSIRSFGCQMNEFDSDLAVGLLRRAGHEIVQDSDAADVILFNTCSVRQHAEDKVFGQLAELKSEKEKRPDLLIGVMGCMVENYKTKFFTDYPHVDILVGTRSIPDLPKAIERARTEKRQVMELAKAGFGYDLYEMPRLEGRVHAYLPIMTGCDKVCSFCVVPYVRGREISRPLKEVMEAVRQLADSGIKHVTLLGQNVNSYHGMLASVMVSPPKADAVTLVPEIALSSAKAGGRTPRNDDANADFPELLDRLCQIHGVEKISFTTSHPSDATEALFQVIAKNPKISRRFHLPLQSGSNRILERMKRDHTLAEYRAKIDRMRVLVPDISVTTDIIVGFPGETEEDYEMTKEALRDIEFDGAFIFKYSPRPHTAAARWEDRTPWAEKNRRNNELLALQKEITRKKNQAVVGSVVKVLVEDRSKKSSQEVLARTWQDKKVVFAADAGLIGSVHSVRLNALVDETFRAEVISSLGSLRGSEATEAISGTGLPAIRRGGFVRTGSTELCGELRRPLASSQ